MPKALLINENLIYSNSLTWILNICTIACMLIFSCIFNPGCPWAQLFALWFSFFSKAMENKLESEFFGKLYVAEVGRRKLSFFPLRNFCIQFVSFPAKQMDILFMTTIFKCTLKILSFKVFYTCHALGLKGKVQNSMS